jgi:alcohol dehydrogenase class IV
MNFEFATTTRIVFGEGKRHELFGAAKTFGDRALVVCGANRERNKWLFSGLNAAGVDYETVSVPAEPTVRQIEEGAALAREFKTDLVIGVGGGSVIDAAKAVAAMITNSGNIHDYLEVIGLAKPLQTKPLPYIAIPTTAGTGAEVTRNSVLTSPERKLKVSLRSPLMLPALATIDPELTYPLPPELTASTGMDALTQVIEPFLSIRANPLTDALCRDAIRRAPGALRKAYRQPEDKTARAEMSLVSLFGGMALANAGLGAVHGFAASIGGMFAAPHGAVCAALLPHALQVNYSALCERAPESPANRRYEELAELLTGKSPSKPEEGITVVRNLCDELQIPKLSHWGIQSQDIDELCLRAMDASSMKANPIHLAMSELREILSRAI